MRTFSKINIKNTGATRFTLDNNKNKKLTRSYYLKITCAIINRVDKKHDFLLKSKLSDFLKSISSNLFLFLFKSDFLFNIY